MPSKNEEKCYIENSYYHLYNRGVEKRIIFQEKQDWAVFLAYLKEYLLDRNEKELQKKLVDPKTNYRERDKLLKRLHLNNFAGKLKLLAYCLMPNHFHLLIHQTSAETIDRFMNSLGTRYVVYFNRKYKRIGPLFQGTYKAVLVETEEQLLHLSRYIHLQSLQSPQGDPLREGYPSSYPNYLGQISQNWVQPDDILAFFKTARRASLRDILSYQSFVEDHQKDRGLRIINRLTLE